MLLRLLGSGFLIIYFLALFGCTLKAVETTEAGTRDSLKGKVLIATQKSKFKRTVVSEIKDNLSENVFYVKDSEKVNHSIFFFTCMQLN